MRFNYLSESIHNCYYQKHSCYLCTVKTNLRTLCFCGSFFTMYKLHDNFWRKLRTLIRVGFRTGQAGQLPRGPQQPGGLHIVCLVTFILWYSRVGWAYIAPLLKAVQGPQQSGGPHIICLVTFILWYSRVGWAYIAPLLKAVQGPPQSGGPHIICLVTFILWYSRVGWAYIAPLLKAAQGPPQPGGLHMSCQLLFCGILG